MISPRAATPSGVTVVRCCSNRSGCRRESRRSSHRSTKTAPITTASPASYRGYVEFFSNVSTERDAEGVGIFGFTYGIGPNIQLNAGMNVGVTRSADDLNPFVGLSVRF